MRNSIQFISCCLVGLLLIISVSLTIPRTVDVTAALRIGPRTVVEPERYTDLSNRIHAMYADDMALSFSDNNETLGKSAFQPLDIRSQSMSVPRAYELVLVHPPSKDCNCIVDDNGRGPCCVRYYRRPHKMGNVQSLQLLPDGVRNLIRITSSEFVTSKPLYDYRDVVLVRDLYSAILSGYLYHLSGRECWLDMYGRPSNVTFRWINNYWTRLDFEASPPRNNRTVCQYFVEESAHHGLAMYAKMSLIWFKDLLKSYRYSLTNSDKHRTMFVCFGQLEASQDKILNHFFPGGHNFDATSKLTQQVDSSYGGGHSTNHNAILRDELKQMLIEIDQTMNDGVLGKMNIELGCVDAL